MRDRYLIASGKHEIYREGNLTVKTFPKSFPKSEVLREALHISLVEGLGLHVPELHSVGITEEGCWAITYDYIEGKTLAQLMEEHPEKMDEYMEQFVSDRFVDFEIITEEVKGLKLPRTAVTTMNFFIVPIECQIWITFNDFLCFNRLTVIQYVSKTATLEVAR